MPHGERHSDAVKAEPAGLPKAAHWEAIASPIAQFGTGFQAKMISRCSEQNKRTS
jgi:hypothetical protein